MTQDIGDARKSIQS